MTRQLEKRLTDGSDQVAVAMNSSAGTGDAVLVKESGARVPVRMSALQEISFTYNPPELTLESGAGLVSGFGAGAGAALVGAGAGALVEVGAGGAAGAFVGVGVGTEGVLSSSSSSSQSSKSSSSSSGTVTVDVGLTADAEGEVVTEGLHCEGRAVSSFSLA